MLINKVYLSIIGVLITLLLVTGIYSYFKINWQSDEIDNLGIMLITKDTQISALETEKRINLQTNQLGIRLTTEVHVELANINAKYNDIKQTTQTKINATDINNHQAISEIVINSIWEGYKWSNK